jgi:hypothetical protein
MHLSLAQIRKIQTCWSDRAATRHHSGEPLAQRNEVLTWKSARIDYEQWNAAHIRSPLAL